MTTSPSTGDAVRRKLLGERPNALALLGAVILTSGVILAIFLDKQDTDEKWFFVCFLGIPTYGVAVCVFFGVVRLGLWILSRFGIWANARVALVLVLCPAATAYFAYRSYHDSLPLTQFQYQLMDPAPASLQDLHVLKLNSWGGTNGALFQFRVSDHDFEALCQRNQLTPVPIDLPSRRKKQAEIESDRTLSADDRSMLTDSLYPEDQSIRRLLRGKYVRPTEPQYFKGAGPGETLLVRDPGTGNTIFYTMSVDPHATSK